MKLLIILAVLLLLVFPAGAEPLLGEDGLSAILTETEAGPERVSLTLFISNSSDNPVTLEIFSPSWNDEPVFFDDWQMCLDYPLEPGETKQIQIGICPDGVMDEARSVSFRFCAGGRITTPARLTLTDGKTESAAFPGTEDLLFRETVLLPENPDEIAPVSLSDSIPAAYVPELAEAYVGIYLREEDGTLRRLSRISVQVREDGRAEALWSGLYPALAGDEPFSVTAWETTEDNVSVWTTDRFTFYGPEIYFARAETEITLDENGARVTGQKVTAGEYNEAACAPFSLFEHGTASALISRMTERDGQPVPAECDADNRTLTTDAPLQLMLLAADDPDRLVICFEYFFRDNSDLVHMVPDETFRGTEDSSSGH